MVKKEGVENIEEIKNSDSGHLKNYALILLLVFSLSLGILGGVYLIDDFYKGIGLREEIVVCGDGTSYGNCSVNKPYYCYNGFLIEKASTCDCEENMIKEGDLCTFEYQVNPKKVNLTYILRGEEEILDFIVYEGMKNYTSALSKFINYQNGEKITRKDFKLKNLNEEKQRQFLLPLVITIQNLAVNKDDQLRIAVSLVQNIPFGSSGKTLSFGKSQEIDYSRYPYEVLYDVEGVCGEKADLLVFLLKELGYESVYFYYPLENHEAVGVKCSAEYSLMETGYCFIETTGPSIITDNEITYSSGEKLFLEPEIIFISEGDSMSDFFYEYPDAQSWKSLRRNIEKKGKISWYLLPRFKRLENKYGLVGVYPL
ncbi:MAG: hypothetical protein KKF68_03535 [Nanoarchaeota archaeon]|nr:hypothetical protein [Nanoarchaeota archaeon]